MKVTIIGAGNMGRGIGTRLVAGGHEVEIVDRDPAEAEKLAQELGGSASAAGPDVPFGEVVVLAVYYPGIKDAVAEHADRLKGAVVVDITNPLNFETFDSLVVPADSSAAAEIAADLPDSRVLKAFNTNFAGTLGSGSIGALTTTVLVAGDDADAKATLADVLSGECSLREVLVDGPGGIRIVPAASGAAEMVNLGAREHAGLIQAFSDIGDELDVLLIDTAAGIGDSVISFVRAAQEVLVVVCDEPTSITDAYALIKVLSRERGVDRIQVVANMVRDPNEGRVLYEKLTRVCDKFLADVSRKGELLAAGLRDLGLDDVRGSGLMLGFATTDGPERARRLLLEQRLVVNATGPDTIRLLPPLTVSDDEIAEGLSRIG